MRPGASGGVLIAASDPITLTDHAVGRHAVVVNANDIAVTGVRPRWFLAMVLLPPGTDEKEVETLFSEIRAALGEVGAALVGGHSEVTAAVTRPVVVGQMLGLAENGRFLADRWDAPGDVVLQVGPVPVEGAAVLATEARGRLAGVDPPVVGAAEAATERPGISVVDAALSATTLGARALHDPTEGGLPAALHEMAAAAGVRLRVDRAQVLWFEPGVALCRGLGADPGRRSPPARSLLPSTGPTPRPLPKRRAPRAGPWPPLPWPSPAAGWWTPRTGRSPGRVATR